MSTAIWRSLKTIKGGRHWETLVAFTLEDLKRHLESQFKNGMAWENYGLHWEIDHKKPLSLCSSFEEAWQLQNLQPLLRAENRAKGNKYIS